MDKVWVLVLPDVQEGFKIQLFKAENYAFAALVDYVTRHWTYGWGRDVPGPMPSDPQERVEAYFDRVDWEEYRLEQMEVS